MKDGLILLITILVLVILIILAIHAVWSSDAEAIRELMTFCERVIFVVLGWIAGKGYRSK